MKKLIHRHRNDPFGKFCIRNYIRLKKISGYCRFWKSYLEFKKRLRKNAEHPRITIKPVVNDFSPSHGFDGHYIYHPAWAARVIARTKPKKHIDIASTLNFCAILSASVPTEFYDYREAALHLSNLATGQEDLTKLTFPDNSIQSLSCMHTVEHIGLGRYGDPIDPDADKKAMSELQRVLASGGNLIFVVPVGKPQIIFNAHRIYSFEEIYENFKELELVEFTLLPDDQKNGLIVDADPALVAEQSYGCGCFWFHKR